MRAKRKKSNEDTNSIEDIIDTKAHSEKEYHRLKVELQKVEKKKKSKYAIFYNVILSLYGISLVALSFCMIIVENINFGLCALLFMAAFMIVSHFITFNEKLENKEIDLQSRIYEYELDNAKEEAEEDIFKNSIKMSSKYLDQYYSQTKEQAQRGFRVTVWVAILGAGLIAVGIVLMFIGKVEPSYVTCASGVIVEFISAIFFYLYNRTVSSMSNYHNKLVLAQNVSIALKVSDSLPEGDSAEAKKLIVTELLKDINDHLIKDDPPTKFGK